VIVVLQLFDELRLYMWRTATLSSIPNLFLPLIHITLVL